MGLHRATDLEGGVEAWLAAGLPMSSVPADVRECPAAPEPARIRGRLRLGERAGQNGGGLSAGVAGGAGPARAALRTMAAACMPGGRVVRVMPDGLVTV